MFAFAGAALAAAGAMGSAMNQRNDLLMELLRNLDRAEHLLRDIARSRWPEIERVEMCDNLQSASTGLAVLIGDRRIPVGGYSLHEYRMGGPDSLNYWIRAMAFEMAMAVYGEGGAAERLRDDQKFLHWEFDRNRAIDRAINPPIVQSQHFAGMAIDHILYDEAGTLAVDPLLPTMLYGQSILSAHLSTFMVDQAEAKARDEEADQRAKDLFIMAAGRTAFNLLEGGGGLAITGSAGTAYELHKKASFCITRVKDGVRFCAVVPGVPLWDHLLGIKLMVEHDEPQFLKTANQSGGDSMGAFLHAEIMRVFEARQSLLREVRDHNRPVPIRAMPNPWRTTNP